MGAEGRHACMQAQRIKQAHTRTHARTVRWGPAPCLQISEA